MPRTYTKIAKVVYLPLEFHVTTLIQHKNEANYLIGRQVCWYVRNVRRNEIKYLITEV